MARQAFSALHLPGLDTERGAQPYLPSDRNLSSLRDAGQRCRGCDIYANATQAVFGEGPTRALMMVGEQPGDQEDLQGHPFVGPAGGVLDRALEKLSLRRDSVYVTNAVKHFKWTPRGKRRIHETPRASELRACQPWLEAEIEAVEPKLIVCLGSLATQSLLGPSIKVMANRGRTFESNYGSCLVTVHPSSILRVQEPAQREPAFDAFVADLRHAVDFLEALPKNTRDAAAAKRRAKL